MPRVRKLKVAGPARPLAGDANTSRARRAAWIAGALICLAALLLQTLLLADGWRHNPLLAVPIVDGDTYWRWAGRIAAGEWRDATPFMSAPLYPYLLGLVRAAGGGLLTVYALQAAAHVFTVVLLMRVAGRAFGTAPGIVAGGLFVLLTEPAFFTGRVLSCTLQLLLVVALWWTLQRCEAVPRPGRWAVAGVLLGLNCLATPPLLLAAPLIAAWAWWQCGWRPRGLVPVACLTLATTLTIAPATLHNYVVSRELILISAQAGVTFAQGNAPGATGLYTPLPGVSATRQSQNTDAMRLYETATGQRGTWRAVNRHFRDRGLAHWGSAPAAMVQLLARKAWYFVSGHNAADIYLPTLERRAGLLRALWLAPLPLAWLMPAALVGVALLVARARVHLPALVLLGIPLLTVVLFFYTPRYRLPAVPVVAALAGWTAVRVAVGARRRDRFVYVGGAALLVGPLLLPLNSVIGFDRLTDGLRATFHHGVGDALQQQGRLAEAAAEFRAAVALQPTDAAAAGNLGNLLRQLGQTDEAVRVLSAAVQAAPADPIVNDQYGRLLVEQGRVRDALPHFAAAVAHAPDSAPLRNNLANALLQTGDADKARREYEAAVRLDPRHADAHLNLGRLLLRSGEAAAALPLLTRAVELNPGSLPGRGALAQAQYETGDRGAGWQTLEAAIALAERRGDAAQHARLRALREQWMRESP